MKKRDLMKDMEIVEKATPGPWQARSWSIPTEDQFFVRQSKEEYPKEIATAWQGARYFEGPEMTSEEAKNNAIFIAESREGWPEAIKRAIEAEKEVARLRTEIQRHIDLMMSAAELMSDDADPEQRAKATAYLTVAKNLRGILDGSKTE